MLKRCSADGALTTKLMTASAVARTHASDLVVTTELWFATEVRELLSRYTLLTSSLLTENQILKMEVVAGERQREVLKSAEAAFSMSLEQSNSSISALRAQLATLRDEGATLQAKVNGYALKLTPNQLAVLGAFLAVVAVVVGVLVPLAVARWGG